MKIFPDLASSGPCHGSVTMCLLVMVLVLDWAMADVIQEAPTVRIVVRVRTRRAPNWDVWQINSNVCPPSLCRSSSETSPVPPPRPRGTGGSVFYQGDIVLDKDVDGFIFPESNSTRYKRATVRMRNRMWKDGVVPYIFGDSLSGQAKRAILRAFKHISQKTCIVFREKKNSNKDFIKFISEPGCWSSIGQTGREQMLSLGRGCENVGTAIHEITHALGAWHEQARRDRDTYVKIIEDNISARFIKDFEMVDRRLSSPRGFPYDYTSIMHYSKYAFTRNGKPTIEVIGLGKELGLTIKQRSGLSTIDMAQLRDMYRCNLHKDTKETSCPKGWYKHDTNCYQFFEHPKVQFAAANRKCKELRSHLVWIETKREDQFLANRLRKKFPYVYTWRTGGRRINKTMTWLRTDGRSVAMKYTNWDVGQPSSFSTVSLQRDRTTNVTRWQGVWAGSMSQLPLYMYPFICERRAKRKCLKLKKKDGRDYRGKLDHTIDGFTCQKWTEQYPHMHNLTRPVVSSDNDNKNKNKNRKIKDDADGLGDHNYCRNPKKERRSRPWCYTTKKTREWQLCDVTACSTSGSTTSSRTRLRNSGMGPASTNQRRTKQDDDSSRERRQSSLAHSRSRGIQRPSRPVNDQGGGLKVPRLGTSSRKQDRKERQNGRRGKRGSKKKGRSDKEGNAKRKNARPQRKNHRSSKHQRSRSTRISDS